VELRSVFDLVKPLLESYIEQKHELKKLIAQNGTLPDDIISECPVQSIVDLKKFDDKTIITTSSFIDWVQENKISTIESDTDNIYMRSEKQKIEGKKGSRTPESMLLSRDRGLKEEQKEYEFTQSLKDYKTKDFYNLLSEYPFNQLYFCEHFSVENYKDIKPVVLVTKEENRYYLRDRPKSIGETLTKTKPEPNLHMFCNDCYNRIEKLCCTDAVVKTSLGYEPHPRHNFDDILLRMVLKKHNFNFNEFLEEGFGRSLTRFYLNDLKAVIIRKHRDAEQIIEKLKPETIIIQGNKQDIIDFLKYDTNLIIFDDSKDSKQRFFLFDNKKQVESNIEKCCLKIIQNLENYSEEIRGKEHDKLIGALERIGKELGFIPQREVESKGARVDLVWLDREGSIFSALEVETSAQWKKDVVTTWETEPKLAVILAHYKSEKGIKDILQYVLLKNMPHHLLFINNITKKAFLIENQNMIKCYDIEKKEEIDSDIFEY